MIKMVQYTCKRSDLGAKRFISIIYVQFRSCTNTLNCTNNESIIYLFSVHYFSVWLVLLGTEENFFYLKSLLTSKGGSYKSTFSISVMFERENVVNNFIIVLYMYSLFCNKEKNSIIIIIIITEMPTSGDFKCGDIFFFPPP